jgi:hypothetical protein
MHLKTTTPWRDITLEGKLGRPIQQDVATTFGTIMHAQ